MKISIDKYLEKIKNISTDNFNQLKKISVLQRQTVTKMTNHFTETIDSEKHSDINYLSDIKQNTHKNKSNNYIKEYYMSEDSNTKNKYECTSSSPKLKNDTESSTTSRTYNDAVYLFTNNTQILPIISINSENNKYDRHK